MNDGIITDFYTSVPSHPFSSIAVVPPPELLESISTLRTCLWRGSAVERKRKRRRMHLLWFMFGASNITCWFSVFQFRTQRQVKVGWMSFRKNIFSNRLLIVGNIKYWLNWWPAWLTPVRVDLIVVYQILNWSWPEFFWVGFFFVYPS